MSMSVLCKRKIARVAAVSLFIAVIVPSALLIAACDESAPDKIVFGQAVSLTGEWSEVYRLTTYPIYQMWIEEMNEAGGIYIEKYGKRLPVELIQYDDEGNVEKMKTLLEKLILEDRVDFLLPPVGTTFLYEAAPLANKYGYVLMGGAGGAIKLKEIISGLPYFFSVLNFADTQMPVLADILEEEGIQSVAILMVDDLLGVEYTGVLVPLLAQKGIDVVMVKSYLESDPDIGDVIANAMMEADSLNADAFLGLTYANGSFTGAGVAMALNYNPKVLQFTLGPNFSSFRDAFGAEAVEGIMGTGAWNAKSSDDAEEFEKKFLERWTDEEIPIEYWGHLYYYAGCQFFQKAIEKAGTLDNAKVRDVMATETFSTVIGPVKFENGMMVGHLGQVGQWQDGVFEVVDPGEHRTADVLFPKPPWPAVEPDTDTDTGGDTDTGTDGADAGK